MLAERGTYLATRMPQLWGLYGDLWLTKWLNNPDLKKPLTDLSQLSKGTSDLASIAEKLPDQIAKEREVAIKQVISQISAERKATLDALLFEERRIEERLISQLIEIMERAERQGKEMVDHTVQRLAILMVTGLIGYMIVRLILLYASNRAKPSVK